MSPEIDELLFKHLKNELSPREKELLDEWKARSKQNQRLFDKLVAPAFLDSKLREVYQVDINEGRRKLHEKGVPDTKGRTISWWNYAAAAAIILLLATGAYLWFTFHQSPERSRRVAAQAGAERNRGAGITPGGNKAILTLASGKKQILTDTDNGKPIPADGVEITTPRGGQYQVVLPDGSKVWLNAASSIKFPSKFEEGKERRVEITGEAYLEVSAQRQKIPLDKGGSREATGGLAARQPFILTTHGTSIQVLGTNFNINAYEDEEAIKTSLLEGSIKIIKAGKEVILKPGQQASIAQNTNNPKIQVQEAPVDDAIAWKNGSFSFNNDDIKTVMRQLSRWYNVEIEYRDPVSAHFLGTISRNLSLQDILFKRLELTGEVHFKLEGKKIIVMK